MADLKKAKKFRGATRQQERKEDSAEGKSARE
jgi:hypothetical protein